MAEQERKKEKKRRRFPWWTLPVIVVCLGALTWVWLTVDDALAQYDKFSAMRTAVAKDVFYGAVYIDDMPVAGMTWDEARQALSSHQQARASAFDVLLVAGDAQWRITSTDVPMQWDTDALLQKAYMIGRIGTLEKRYSQATALAAGEPVYLYSQFTYDRDVIRQRTNSIAQGLSIDAVDAAVVAFDVVNRTFAYSDEQPGQTVDADALYNTVIDHLEGGEGSLTIEVPVIARQPNVTRAQMESSYTRMASFTTKTTSDKNRNNNIRIAASALNGKMIAPHGTISFNETTGQRTPEKGYLEAGAIENGRTVQEYGGGVCQVSSTLFNALLRADAEIVSRKPHAWPSDYVPRGEDATVDWPSLDLVMRNPSDAPMFLTAWYEDQKVTVEVYGLSLGEGVTIDLESETTYSKTPTDVVYTYNASLPVGTAPQLLKKARTGYSVTTYKIWKQDGVETSRERLYTSEYRAINEEYEYNDGNPPAPQP